MISVDALVSYAEELEAATSGSGLAWLTNLRAQALARITGGGSTEYISTTVNGQTFMGKITSTAEDWFDVLSLAIKQINGTAAKVVYARTTDFPH